MISKPLFKQSIKANWGIWTVVTAATCFMLAIIVTFVGGDTINNAMNSVGDAFVKDSVRSEIESATMNYFYTASVSIEGFEAGVASLAPPHFTEEHLIASVAENIADGAREDLLVNGESVDNAENAAVAAGDFVKAFLTEYASYRDFLADGTAQSEFVTTFVAELLAESMPDQLMENGLTERQISDFNFTSEGIKTIANNSINLFRAQVSIKYPASEYPSLGAIAALHPDAIDGLIQNLSKSIMSELPENAQENLFDMQELDLAQLMTGTVFFKIAGILLPVIYIIIVSISLIAGQVDSGSMAYIVSTPTKRRTITLTQMLFMVSSLLVMCLLTTATGLVSLLIVGESSISYTQMILLNATMFVTLFAFAGICFLASAWFNRSKHAMAIGGGLSMYFVVATIMGMFGSPEMPSIVRMDSMNLFNYTTIIGLFDSASIFANTNDFIPQMGVLLAIGLAGFIVGILRFNKKDLPL
jgi:ABC-2 type transport system permease protein